MEVRQAARTSAGCDRARHRSSSAGLRRLTSARRYPDPGARRPGASGRLARAGCQPETSPWRQESCAVVSAVAPGVTAPVREGRAVSAEFGFGPPPRADTRMDKQNDVQPESTLCGGKAVLIDRRGERCESSKYRPWILTWPRPFSKALSGHFSRQLYPADVISIYLSIYLYPADPPLSCPASPPLLSALSAVPWPRLSRMRSPTGHRPGPARPGPARPGPVACRPGPLPGRGRAGGGGGAGRGGMGWCGPPWYRCRAAAGAGTCSAIGSGASGRPCGC